MVSDSGASRTGSYDGYPLGGRGVSQGSGRGGDSHGNWSSNNNNSENAGGLHEGNSPGASTRDAGSQTHHGLQAGDLVDVCFGVARQWREAVILELDFESGTELDLGDDDGADRAVLSAKLHVLFESDDSDARYDLLDWQAVRPYGSMCFTGNFGMQRSGRRIRNPLQTLGSNSSRDGRLAWSPRITTGCLVDVLDYHPAHNSYRRAQILQKRERGGAQVRFLEGGQIEEIFYSMLKPYGSKTFDISEHDNRVRKIFIERRFSRYSRFMCELQQQQQQRQQENPCVQLHWSGVRLVDSPPLPLGPRNGIRMQEIYYDEFSPFGGSDDYMDESKGGNENYYDENRSHERGIAALSEQFQRYTLALQRQGLSIVEMEGDGNCMFRAMSHQVYGTPAHHATVRSSCMDYMDSERNYFEPFIVGGAVAFDAYIARKRCNGVWGDDLELQAMCEIYDRPAQVYAFDPVRGASQLRTFHEGDSQTAATRVPIRLSFYGGGHYDSLVGGSFSRGLCRQLPAGSLEQMRVTFSRARRSGSSQADQSHFSENQRVEQAVLDDAIKASRCHYMANEGAGDLDNALRASLESVEKEEMQDALDESLAALSDQAVIDASDRAATEQQELEHVLKMSSEQDELNMALRLSKDEVSASGNSTSSSDTTCTDNSRLVATPPSEQKRREDEQLAAAIQASKQENSAALEQQQLAQALLQSQLESSAISADAMQEDDEQALIQAALHASKMESKMMTDDDIQKAIEESLNDQKRYKK